MITPENIVVTGEMDGEVIWREKTASERLIEALGANADNPSARRIVLQKVAQFNKNPSERLQDELESMGLIGDFKESDWGTGPDTNNEY